MFAAHTDKLLNWRIFMTSPMAEPRQSPERVELSPCKCRLHKRREVDKCLGRTLILFSHIVQHAQSETLDTSAEHTHECVCVDVSMTCTCVSRRVFVCASAAPPAHCHSHCKFPIGYRATCKNICVTQFDFLYFFAFSFSFSF